MVDLRLNLLERSATGSAINERAHQRQGRDNGLHNVLQPKLTSQLSISALHITKPESGSLYLESFPFHANNARSSLSRFGPVDPQFGQTP